jgi:HlyD family secretion protein
MAEKGKRKKLVWTLTATLVALLIIAVFVMRGQAPIVPVVEVSRENLSATITSNGKVEPISPTVARAEFPTFVSKVMATEGQAVRRGQLILTLDAADIRSQLAQARGNLLAAKTDLQNAQAGGPPEEVARLQGDLKASRLEVANLERAEKALEALAAKQAATQGEVTQNRAILAKARANLQALEAKKQALEQRSAVIVEGASLRVSQEQNLVEALEEKVRSATVTSPINGTLYSLPVKAGDYVKVGDTLAEMADLRHVRVRAFVDEPDLGALEAGQDVEVTWDAKPGHVWSGRTEQVPKQVVARGMRSVGEVLCSVDNNQLDLLPNVNVQVRILVHERRGALVVPRAAVREDNGKRYVFVLLGNKLHRRDISVGIASASKYEVLKGLTAGERVALPGEHELRDGLEIRPSEGD